MRPIIKGETPTDNAGNTIVFSEYARSRRYLIDRIGEYCSYCERKIEANLAVEHVQPKDSNPQLALEWSNFLLGCTNCNSTKGKKQVILNEYVWPDIDDTYSYFLYNHTGIVQVSPEINDPNLMLKIQKMLDLVGLQKSPPRTGSADWEKASDRRYEHRIQAWVDANRYMKNYTNKVQDPPLYFWRDQHGHEIDLVLDEGSSLAFIEIKSGQTFQRDFFKNIDWINQLNNTDKGICIFGGDKSINFGSKILKSWKDLF